MTAGGRLRSTVAPAVAAVIAYLSLALWAVEPALKHGFATTTNCNCYDVDLEQWFLGWDAHAEASGHLPFITHALDAPYAVNTLWNTSLLLPGTLLAPLTRAEGPLVTYNVLVVVALVSSASAACVLLRRWTQGWFPAFLGGLVYGFGPYVVAGGPAGHLHLMLAAFSPLMVAALDDLVVRRDHPPWRPALRLGVLATAQLLVAEEVLAQFAVLAAVALVLVLLARRPVGRDYVQRLLHGTVVAAAVTAVLAGPLLAIQFFGSGHIHGSAQPVAQLNLFSADLTGPVVPSSNQLLDPSAADAISRHFTAGYAPESAGYLGPLLIVAVIATVLLRRRRVVLLAAAVGAVAFVLSLGPTLIVANHDTGVPLPFALLRHLPLVDSFIAARFAFGMDLAAALILAVTVDRLMVMFGSSPARATAGKLLAAAVAAGCLVPLLPDFPFPATRVDLPAYFTEPARTVTGTTFVYPYPRNSSAQAMVWQASSDFRFSMMGGYAVVPDPSGHGAFEPDTTSVERDFVALHDTATPLPALTPQLVAQYRHELCEHHVTALIVVMDQPQAKAAVAAMSVIAGGQWGVTQEGVTDWPHVNVC